MTSILHILARYHPSLPPELIDIIIDLIAEDRETLRAFSVASRSCVPRCRKHLFRTIEFSTDYGTDILAERHESFCSIVTRDPRVLTYVRELVVRDIESDDDESSWMITHTQFHATLYDLGPYLRHFSFTVVYYEWDNFLPSLKLAFMSIFSSQTIRSISLQGLEGIPSACCVALAYAQLADLTIVRSSFTHTTDRHLPEIESSLIPQNLYWLCVEDVDEESINVLLNAWIPAPAEGQDRPLFPRLTALSIGPTDEDVLGPISKLVQAGRDTIQYFYWDYAYGSQSRPLNTQPLNLSILQSLFAVKYEVAFHPLADDEGEAMPDSPDHFDGLISLLQSVRPGAIQQVEVKLDFKDFGMVMESLESSYGWDDLESVIASESFGHVHNFTLQVGLETFSSEDGMDLDFYLDEGKAAIETRLEERLPLLSAMDSHIFILTVERQMI